MPTQQVIAPPARAGMFIVVTVDDGAEERVRDLLTEVSGLARSVGFRRPYDELLCVIGIGAQFWDRMFGADTRPLHLHPFEELRGARHHAPSTPGDLLIHLRSKSPDVCFELAALLVGRLRGLGTVVDEVHGFKFFDDRDLLGFVDGTENPEGKAAGEAVLIGDDDPRYAGGSYVIVQKYLHDMDAWNSLSVEEQQRVIGRTKLEDIELSDETKPSNSHVALNTIELPDGTQRQIMRDNMPFGSLGEQEFGTYFIGYAADPGVTEQMLRNMFIGKPEGNTDRILDFSTAVTGALFFVPPVEFLDDPDPQPRPDAEEQSEQSDDEDSESEPSSGSLHIGALNHRTAERGTP